MVSPGRRMRRVGAVPGARQSPTQEPGHNLVEQERAPVPAEASLPELRQAVKGCRACPLWARATNAVFGAGQESARVMFVGEQPGATEDKTGKPFVGPAGRMLDKALETAEIPREDVYVTNAVKHFKWEQKGKLHLHSKPNTAEVGACRPWLEAEIEVVRPRLIVCLGATAARSVLGKATKILENRGRILEGGPVPALITIHPSMLLRMPVEDREQGFQSFVKDLLLVRDFLK